MIRIVRAKGAKPDDFNELWLAMRRPRSTIGRIHVPELAPPDALFREARYLQNRESFTRRYFEEDFAPRYIQHLLTSEAQTALARLWELDTQGKSVGVACACADETLCHRSILAGILAGEGCLVRCERDVLDYAGFHGMYLLEKARLV